MNQRSAIAMANARHDLPSMTRALLLAQWMTSLCATLTRFVNCDHAKLRPSHPAEVAGLPGWRLRGGRWPRFNFGCLALPPQIGG